MLWGILGGDKLEIREGSPTTWSEAPESKTHDLVEWDRHTIELLKWANVAEEETGWIPIKQHETKIATVAFEHRTTELRKENIIKI